MTLDGEQWLAREFLPVVAALPDSGFDADPKQPPTQQLLAGLSTWRLLGALDALRLTGVLTAEQDDRARAALENKGVRQQTFQSSVFTRVSFMAGVAAAEPSVPEALQKDRLRHVVAVGRSFGLVDGDDAIVTAIEVWERHVRAGLLIAISDDGRERQRQDHDQMREWMERRRAGEVTDADRPDRLRALSMPGASTTWTMDGGGLVAEGRCASGQSGQDWWRVDVEWDIALPATCRELVIGAVEEDRPVGRLQVSLGT